MLMFAAGGALAKPPAPALPNAVNDTRNIAAAETSVLMEVLANDENIEGGIVTIPTPATGADAEVSGQSILVTRQGTGAGSYSLTYRVTTATGFDQATLSGSIAAASGGTVGPIEPVSGDFQVAITVGTNARQTWRGFGWGNASANLFSPVTTHIAKLTTEINASVIRFFTPENTSTFISKSKPWWDLVKIRGIDTVFSSSFIYRAAPDVTPEAVADGIDASIAAGINPTLWTCTLQNEPDGHVDNAVTGGTSVYISHQTRLRNRLNALGRQAVKVLSLEWRHPTVGGITEYDVLNGGGAVSPTGVVTAGCLHIYDKSPDNNLYDNRYLTKGCPLWSTETGNNGSPNCQARMLAGVNHGTEVEIIHYAMVTTPTPNAEQLAQALLEYNGNPRPWYGACLVISTNLVRGTRLRLCQSSDRPSGLNTTHADRMIRQPTSSGGRNPRQQVIVGRRTDNCWVIAAVNTTHGSDEFNNFTGGHYGALSQQLTVTIPELSGLDREFSAKRADINGSVSGPTTVNLKNGVTRFTLQPGETIAMTSTV